MPGPRRAPARRAVHLILAVAVLAACADDDDAEDDEPPSDQAAPGTTEPILIEITPPLELSASADPTFLTAILDDDVVTADEVETAYERFVACLADGGGAGIYAFDLSLRVAYTEFSIGAANADANDQAELEATCSRDFLGDLIPRYNEANPPDEDLAQRQRDSIEACVRAINPEIADAIPDELTLDTSQTGASVGDLQLDATALGAGAGEDVAVGRCIGALGVEWTSFG